MSGSEPDILLRRLDGEQTRFYHERCVDAAMQLVQGAGPEVWLMTHRHINAAAN